MNEYDDQPVTLETKLANERHDSEHHTVTMDRFTPLRSQRIGTAVLGPLTDKKIARYEAQGYYSEAYRTARRELWASRSARKSRREGNFLIYGDGRKIFSPV